MTAAADLILAADLSQSAGPLGLLVVVLMGIATVLLVRNMNTRLKRLPREFEPPPEDRPDGPDRTP